jgi:hypothetical protein
MCMKCGCSTPNDMKNHVMHPGSNGGSGQTVIVPASPTRPGNYEDAKGY